MENRRILKDLGKGAFLMGGETPQEMELNIPVGAKLEKPVFLTNQLNGLEDCDTTLELHVSLAEGAEAEMVIDDRSAEDLPFHSERTISIDVAAGASFALYTLAELNPQSTSINKVQIKNAGSVRVGTFSLTGGVEENSLFLDFTGEGASCELFGMTIASEKQQVRNVVQVTHRVAHCTDRELFKQILDDEAVGRFEGLVRVCPRCPGADSQQVSRNICLSRSARAFAQPQLVIDTDDVRCSHGTTVGQLDEEALFYMQQRGISRHEARLLLLSAFLDEVIEKVTIPSIRDRLHLLAEGRLRGELNHCVACGACKKG
ncbi:MAG: SufD family Fe-S cluster assembly protein [Bacteroidaceae bacterium]|nr:SufD family Fe-S cluster assembly protein [Bacteroidaceae bacterium]